MDNKKWNIIGFIAISLTIILGGIAVILLISSSISFIKYLHASKINATNKL